jgi:hypothetical protein
MAGKNTAVFGIYDSQSDAERAVSALQSAGFRNTDISVLFADNEGTKDFAHDKGTKAPEGATTGASTGAAVGGVLGWLTGIGALAIPGLGPFIAAGPIMAALAGIGVGGVMGGLAGALIGMGIPEYEAKRYEGRIKKGGILLSVHSDNSEWTDRAKKILEQTGAQDVSSASEKAGDFQNTDKPMPRAGSSVDAAMREGLRETERSLNRDRVVASETVDEVVIDEPTFPRSSTDKYPKG